MGYGVPVFHRRGWWAGRAAMTCGRCRTQSPR
jgi:hypothetical protein